LLPREQDGMDLRHVVEARHESFADPSFVELARNAGVAICLDDSDTFPLIADATAEFVYARLLRAREEEPDGYPAVELDQWASRTHCWTEGREDDLPKLSAGQPRPRDVFLFMINGAKVRAPAAAQALIARL
jgi:uncharacterized protein YecE (DUF72 family)